MIAERDFSLFQFSGGQAVGRRALGSVPDFVLPLE